MFVRSLLATLTGCERFTEREGFTEPPSLYGFFLCQHRTPGGKPCTQETWPPNSCKSWAGSFHYLTTYPVIFKKLFLPRYPGCVQWELDHPTALPLMKRKSRLTLPSVCLLLHGRLVSGFPYSLASEICLFNLDHGEKAGCQRRNGPLSSLCWAPHVCSMPWCRAEDQSESRKLQMLWVQELIQSGPLLFGAFKHADSLTLHDRG